MTSRRNSVVLTNNHRQLYRVIAKLILCAAIVILIMAVSACASPTAQNPPQPTGELILFTPTPTMIPVTATATLPAPPSASDLVLTPRVVDTGFDDDAPILSAALLDLAVETGIEVRQIVPVSAEIVHWRGDSLACDNELLRLSTQGIAGYQVTYLIDNTVYVYHTSGDEFVLCDEYAVNTAPAHILIQIDPIAADLVALAQRRIASELDLSTRRVEVVEVTIETWSDSSLGCPAEGQTYEDITTNGYRIVLLAGGEQYLFHTSFDRLIQCENPSEAVNDES